MPKIFDYLGFIFFFYSNDHEPIHIHVEKGDKIVKVEMFFIDTKLERISIRKPNGHVEDLTRKEREKIRTFVEHKHSEILKKWNDFRAGKSVRVKKITKEIK